MQIQATLVKGKARIVFSHVKVKSVCLHVLSDCLCESHKWWLRV